ncbi:MAG: hypothetical protein JXB29_09405 [Sedimentisphaerales bacterium]|nr:hypothetical protein [Sedimentisphaerales bacterium]
MAYYRYEKLNPRLFDSSNPTHRRKIVRNRGKTILYTFTRKECSADRANTLESVLVTQSPAKKKYKVPVSKKPVEEPLDLPRMNFSGQADAAKADVSNTNEEPLDLPKVIG